MIKPTLLILAAGLSSRYKLGLKQMDTFGPSGETLLDYAIYDAINAGFDKAVFVIRKNIKEDFENLVTYKYKNKIECEFVFQELNDLPAGYNCPAGREKPWGTGHAVWVARDKIKGPFAVINADDFYGTTSYKTMANFLLSQSASSIGDYAMIGYPLKNTLSDYGSVSRGICSVQSGYLLNIDERTNIQKQNGSIIYTNTDGITHELNPESIVSMNFWGVTPDIFSKFENSFSDFLAENMYKHKSEFYLPSWINKQISQSDAKVKVLTSSSQWIGVTYPEDKAAVKDKLRSFTEAGAYPSNLF